MIVPYSLNSSADYINEYYNRQIQAGGNLPAFIGATVQQGSGIGGIFSKFIRGMGPVLKTGAKMAGQQLLNTGLNIANDIIDGKKFADAAKSNLNSGGKRLLTNLTSAFNAPKKGVAKKRSMKGKVVKMKRRRVNKDIFS